MSDLIADLLARHKVTVHPVEQHRGPTTTLHTYRLGDGVKVSAFTGLATDMAVAVGQESVIIHAPVKGTNLVGVEVPNTDRLFPTFAFDRVHDMPLLDLAPLSFPVGVNQENRPVIASLTKMPHLLIAGQTGAGKSVALTTLITALIAQHSPAELEIDLIDPKRVELGMFEDAPQVRAVTTNVDDVAERLDEIVFEMDRRYEAFEEISVRNITEWNVGDEQPHPDDMPYIVVVIDELADLMIQRKKDVEPLLVRIAQLGRAAGIHLVLATQRPTRDVITGLIKANVPSRWAFAVTSTTDSMVILDQPGANALIGKGDSLWHPAGAPAPERVQAYLTPDAALTDVVQWAIDEWPEDTVWLEEVPDEREEYVPAEDIPALLAEKFDQIAAHGMIDENLSEKIGVPVTIDAGLGGPLGPGLVLSDTSLKPNAHDLEDFEELAALQQRVDREVAERFVPDWAIARKPDPINLDALTAPAAVGEAHVALLADMSAVVSDIKQYADEAEEIAGRHKRNEVDSVAEAGYDLGYRMAPWIFAGGSFALALFVLHTIWPTFL